MSGTRILVIAASLGDYILCRESRKFFFNFHILLRKYLAGAIAYISYRVIVLSYRVRGVGGSCVEHLTVESYTIIISLQSYLLSYLLLLLVFHHPFTLSL